MWQKMETNCTPDLSLTETVVQDYNFQIAKNCIQRELYE